MKKTFLWVLTFTFACATFVFGQETPFIKLLVFRDGEAREIALAIARATGLNLVVDSSVSGSVSLHLKDVSAEEALSLLAQAIGGRLVKTEKGFLLTKQPQAPILQVEFQDGKVTVNAQSAEAAEVLRQIAEKGKVNLILSTDLPQIRVTLSLRGVSVEEAINLVSKAAGWEVQREGAILKVQRVGATTITPPVPTIAPTTPSSPLPAQKPTTPPAFAERQEATTKEAKAPERVPTTTKKGLVTLEAVNAPLSQVIEEIARQAEIDVLVVGSLDGKVTVKLKDVPAEEALKVILAGTKYTVLRWENRQGESEGKVEEGKNPTTQNAPQRQRFLIGEWGDPSKWASPNLVSLLETKRFPLRYLKAEQVPQILSPAIPTGIVKVLADQNAVLVTGPKEFLERVERELVEADKPSSQVVIEAQVMEVSERALRQLGLTFAGQKGILKGEIGTANFPGILLVVQEGGDFASQFFAQIQGMIERGEAKTLANPKIAAVSGKKATIEVIQELYFRTAPFFGPTPTPQPTPIVPFFQLQAISAGVKLEIVPMIGSEGDILLEVTPEVSSVIGFTAEGLPQLSTRRATATVWVKEGQIVVLGGLRQREETRTTVKTPLLSEIPLLGELFKSHRKEVRESELMILLVPKLVKVAEQGEGKQS